MNYDYWLWDSKLSPKFCNLMLKEIDWSDEETAKISLDLSDGAIINEKERKTKVIWQNPVSILGCIIDSHIRAANKQAGWNMTLTETEQIQIGKYGVLGKYDWHADITIHKFLTNDNPRKLSCSILLNDVNEFEGGDFEIKNLEQQPLINQGSIIVFPSIIEHRVTPVTKGVRYSAVSWMHGTKVNT